MTPQEQINKLANFIMEEVDGEPSQSEGTIDTAIRIIREQEEQINLFLEVFKSK